MNRRLLAAAQSLRIDHTAAEVFGAFDQAGLRALLLKGPAFAKVFYSNGESRPYRDVDLLISEQDEDLAEATLRGLGFAPYEGTSLGHPAARIHTWQRVGMTVELHTTLVGIDAPPLNVWRTLSKDSTQLDVGGRVVATLSLPGHLLHAALHAAQHGRSEQRPHEDLRRAVCLYGLDAWERAASLAAHLEATDAFSAGLRMLPQGAELADKLEVRPPVTTRVLLRARGNSAPLTLNQVWAQRNLEDIRRVVAPTRAFMRNRYSLARRGRIGLMLSYPVRTMHLAIQLPFAVAEVLLTKWRRRTRA